MHLKKCQQGFTIILLYALWGASIAQMEMTSRSEEVPVEKGGIKTIVQRVEAEQWRASEISDLVDFLISCSTGRQVYILFDQFTESLSSAMKNSHRRGADTNIYRYNSSLSPLARDLRSYEHREYLRNIIVMCTPGSTVDIFRQVTELILETPTIHWYVILWHDVMHTVLSVIREGTQISVAVKTEEGKYQLSRSYVDKEGHNALRQVGSWWRPPGGGRPQSYLREPLYLDLLEAYSDFGGRVMRSSVVNNWPFFEVEVDWISGRAQPKSGIDFHLINTLSEKLNFTYELLVARDGQWGGVLPNGSVTGMIGMVARREVNFAINEITITGPREVVVDFSKPYFHEASTLVSPAPAEKNRAFAVFSPFTPNVWALIATATLAIGPIMWAFTLMKRDFMGTEHGYSLPSYSFNMFRSLTVQGNAIRHTQWTHRFILFTWFFFCFVVYALYAGTLTAMLAIPAYDKPIDSLWDLLEAIKHEGYMLNVVFQSANEFIFKDATQGIYMDLWNVFDPSIGYVHSWTEGVEKVLTGKFSYMNAQLGAEIRALRLGRHKFHFARNTFYPQSYGIPMNSGAPYKAKFDQILLQLTAAGLVDKWTHDELARVVSPDDAAGGAGRGPGPITLVHLQAAFFLLAIGYLTAGGVLVVERFSRLRCCRRQTEE